MVDADIAVFVLSSGAQNRLTRITVFHGVGYTVEAISLHLFGDSGGVRPDSLPRYIYIQWRLLLVSIRSTNTVDKDNGAEGKLGGYTGAVFCGYWSRV